MTDSTTTEDGATAPALPARVLPFDKMKLIFLDVDGVLNSVKNYVVYGKYPFPNERWKRDKTFLIDAYAFDKVAVMLVNQLCKVTGANIVISSTWRDQFNIHLTIKMFEEIGIDPKYIIGRTDSWTPSSARGDQIHRFLTELQKVDRRKWMRYNNYITDDMVVDVPITIDSYVILDDLDGYTILPEQEENTVKTSSEEGLSLADTLKAGAILTGNDGFSTKHLQGKLPLHAKPLW